MTFRDALHATLQGIVVKVLVPAWAMGFTKSFRHIRLAFDELQVCKVAERFTYLMIFFVAIPYGNDSRAQRIPAQRR
jgi:hypothetical protein